VQGISATTRACTFTVAAILCLLVLSGVLMFAWPDSWPIHTPVAALFGPMLAMKMGFPEGPVAFVVVVAFALPCAFKTNWLTFGLLVLAIVVWCFTGVVAGQWLWA
jgi:hypothetical protein